MLVRRRLLRLFRLLVALAALFTAHPSTAARAQIDEIVLVAGADLVASTVESEE
jgi:hypothetical protein